MQVQLVITADSYEQAMEIKNYVRDQYGIIVEHFIVKED